MTGRLSALTAAGVAALMVVAAAGTAAAREVVRFDGFEPGTIVVRTAERKLYFVEAPGRAIRYPIAVGMPGKEWSGATTIGRKEVNPIWSPPLEVRRDKPSLPNIIPPGPANPLGPRAMVLSGTEYAIHGTNNPRSIGTRASYGCIRMLNDNVVELYDRVSVGTRVVVQ
jgi:lipoprotein-anchoring transpeptidase ErfK/SrfK